jgi:tRNA pseudouridine32 synthase / 23S rRNA pseudouridine746 synthase
MRQLGVHIHHQDPHLVVVCKPAGLLSVPGKGPDKQDCQITRLQQDIPDALVVHRLDMSTSGLMVFARSKTAQKLLSAAFANREIGKQYVAIVGGMVKQTEGDIDLPLLTDWPHRPLQKIDLEHGKPAHTHYRVLHRDTPTHCTRLLLEPTTGRSHQLRVHLLALGHPIWGDALYAPAAIQAQASRLCLHASALSLVHPVTKQRLDFADMPPF